MLAALANQIEWFGLAKIAGMKFEKVEGPTPSTEFIPGMPLKPASQKNREELLGCVSKGKDKNGFFIYTHRARSKSYPSIDAIPISKIKFVESTG